MSDSYDAGRYGGVPGPNTDWNRFQQGQNDRAMWEERTAHLNPQPATPQFGTPAWAPAPAYGGGGSGGGGGGSFVLVLLGLALLWVVLPLTLMSVGGAIGISAVARIMAGDRLDYGDAFKTCFVGLAVYGVLTAGVLFLLPSLALNSPPGSVMAPIWHAALYVVDVTLVTLTGESLTGTRVMLAQAGVAPPGMGAIAIAVAIMQAPGILGFWLVLSVMGGEAFRGLGGLVRAVVALVAALLVGGLVAAAASLAFIAAQPYLRTSQAMFSSGMVSLAVPAAVTAVIVVLVGGPVLAAMARLFRRRDAQRPAFRRSLEAAWWGLAGFCAVTAVMAVLYGLGDRFLESLWQAASGQVARDGLMGDLIAAAPRFALLLLPGTLAAAWLSGDRLLRPMPRWLRMPLAAVLIALVVAMLVPVSVYAVCAGLASLT